MGKAAAPAWRGRGRRCRRCSLHGQFEMPYGPTGPPTLFTIPVLRYMKTYGLTHEQLAMVSVIQREWAAKNPRATFKDPITVEDVLNSRMIAYPFRLLMCCLVTDGGGALIMISAERAKDFPQKPVYMLGTGESVETPMVSQMEDFTSSRAFRVAGPTAFAEAGITHDDVDHLMIYDAFAHLPLYGLEDLGFWSRARPLSSSGTATPRTGGQLPLNTNGGGLSYMHSGMYGMYALQESVRQMRGTAPAQVPAPSSASPRRRRHVRRLRHDRHDERGLTDSASRQSRAGVCRKRSDTFWGSAALWAGRRHPG